MRIEPAEVLAVLVGTASDEIRSAVLNALKDHGSNVSEWLRVTERWAAASFRRAPAGAEAITNAGHRIEHALPSIVMKAAISGLVDVPPRAATLEDFRLWCLGKASSEAESRVRRALSDQSSELMQSLAGLEAWAATTFRGAAPPDSD